MRDVALSPSLVERMKKLAHVCSFERLTLVGASVSFMDYNPKEVAFRPEFVAAEGATPEDGDALLTTYTLRGAFMHEVWADIADQMPEDSTDGYTLVPAPTMR